MDVFVHAVSLIVFVIPLTVTAASQLQIIFTDQTHNIQKGTEVRLTCVISGGNNPHMTWISTKGHLPLNSMTENNGQTLVISGFDVVDNGQYLCVASDGLHFVNHMFSVQLSATQKPSMTSTQQLSSSTAVPSTSQQRTTNIFATLTNIQTAGTSPSQEKTTSTTAAATPLPPTTAPTPPPPPTTLKTTVISTPNGHVHTSGLVCMRCRDVVSPAYCTQTIQCGPHEECYLQNYLRDGRMLYKQDCMPTVACGGMNPFTQILGRRRQADESVLCEACCSNFSRCNIGGLCGAPGVTAKIFDISVSPLRYNLGDDVEITCSAMGVPKPSVQWSVLVSRDKFPHNLHLQVNNDGSTLQIENFSHTNEHQYECTAKNSNGEDKQLITLRAI